MRKNYTALNVGQEDFAETVGNINEHELNSRFKILFLGDEGVGKTALIQRFLTNEFSEKYSPTVGMDFKSNTLFLGGRITKLKIWDASGHQKFRSLIPQYIRDADVIVVFYDVSSKESFESIGESWMRSIEQVKSTSEILLVMIGTKTDLVSERAVSEKEARGVAKEFKALHFEVSAKEGGDQCKEIFQTIAKRWSDVSIKQRQ